MTRSDYEAPTTAERRVRAAAGGAWNSSARREQALMRYLGAINRHEASLRQAPAQPTRPRPASAGSAVGPEVAVDTGYSRVQVAEVMACPVVAIRESAPFKEIAKAMAAAGVSALPVVDAANHVHGVVSEADLLAAAAMAGPAAALAGVGGGLGGHVGPGRAGRTGRGGERTAGELMTTPAITVRPDTPVADAAALAARHRIKRLPVVDDAGRLVGIVSRSDLLRVFLRSDEAIREQILLEVVRRICPEPDAVDVSVSDGVVTLAGQLDRRMANALTSRVAEIDGVVDVVDRLRDNA